MFYLEWMRGTFVFNNSLSLWTAFVVFLIFNVVWVLMWRMPRFLFFLFLQNMGCFSFEYHSIYYHARLFWPTRWNHRYRWFNSRWNHHSIKILRMEFTQIITRYMKILWPWDTHQISTFDWYYDFDTHG